MKGGLVVLAVLLMLISCVSGEGLLDGWFGSIFGSEKSSDDLSECPVSLKQYQSLVDEVAQLKAHIKELERECPDTDYGSCCVVGSLIRRGGFRGCLDGKSEKECHTLGGVYSSGALCSQLSKDECPALVEVKGACCLGSSSGGCLDSTTEDACDSLGGSFFSEQICDSLPVGACANPDDKGSCCHPKISYVNSSGVFPVKCLDELTQYKCNLLQGAWTNGGQCEFLGPNCPALGACCHIEGIQPKCTDGIVEAECEDLSGTYHSGINCGGVDGGCQLPPESVGACCRPKISYVNESGVFPVQCLDSLTEHKCGLLQGVWSEDAMCSGLGDTCPALGACCYNDEGIISCGNGMLEEECSALSGSFSPNQVCSQVPAETCGIGQTVTGSCCHPKISYVNESGVFPVKCLDSLTEYKCKLLQGNWSVGNQCSNLGGSCPSYGACCYQSNEGPKCAQWMLETNCQKLNGQFQADKTCNEVQDACDLSPVVAEQSTSQPTSTTARTTMIAKTTTIRPWATTSLKKITTTTKTTTSTTVKRTTTIALKTTTTLAPIVKKTTTTLPTLKQTTTTTLKPVFTFLR